MGKVVAVDFDDVLADTNTAIAEYNNAEHGTNYTRADVYTFDLNKIWGVTKEEGMTRFDGYIASVQHAKAPLVDGVCEALSTLRTDGWNIVIVTSRPERYRAHTVEWLKENLGGQFDELVLTSQFQDPDSSITKASVATEHGAQVFIEDAPHHAEELSHAGIPVLLFDAPWNQSVPESPNIIRIKTWAEAVAWIKQNERA